MNPQEQHEQMVRDAFAVLDKDTAGRVSPIAEKLFGMIYDDLKKAILGNPIEHHPIVLGHMLEIATSVKSPYIAVEQAAALALLHDISAVRKITTQMVDDARRKDPTEGDYLELERQENRILHMREGSSMAHRYLLQVNDSFKRIAFDSRAIDNICEAIRIHDNPSLDIPIQRSNWLAVTFREADRLWMITHMGILADLARKEEQVKDASPDAFCYQFCKAYAAQLKNNEPAIAAPDTYRKQLEKNMRRFCEERELYRPFEPSEGPFCDGEAFFRTKAGHSIYQRLRDEAYKRLETKSG